MSKKALLIGINYTGTPNQLGGCINDVRSISNLLVTRYNYHPADVVVITDEPNCPFKPNGRVIMDNIKWLVSGAKSGDQLFFMYSGHGGQIKDTNNDETDKMDEVMFCLDVIITDDQLYQALIAPLASGVKLTCLFDCCHSGTILDLKYNYTYTAPNKFNYTIESKIDPAADVVMFSGCTDSQTSADGTFGGKWITDPTSGKQVYKWDEGRGAFTYYMEKALQTCNYNCTWEQLLKNICDLLIATKQTQRSQLSVSKPQLTQCNMSF